MTREYKRIIVRGHHMVARSAARTIAVADQSAPVFTVSPAIQQQIKKPAHVRGITKPAHSRQSKSAVLKRSGITKGLPRIAPRVMKQIGNTATVSLQQSKRSRRHVHPALVFAGSAIAAAALVFGGGLLFFGVQDKKTDKYSLESTLGASTVASVESSTASDGTAELRPTAAELSNYKTAADMPRLLKVPRLNIQSRVVTVGTDGKGLPTAPQNIHDSGWFDASAKPGLGVTVLNGSTAGKTNVGIFGSLETLIVGDVLQVERGDGTVVSYKITVIKRFDTEKLDKASIMEPAIRGKSGLNLLAANSRYNTKTSTFEQRLLVQAVQQ